MEDIYFEDYLEGGRYANDAPEEIKEKTIEEQAEQVIKSLNSDCFFVKEIIPEIINIEEVQEAAQKYFIRRVDSVRFDYIKTIKELFNISTEFVWVVVSQKILQKLKDDNYDEAIKLKKYFFNDLNFIDLKELIENEPVDSLEIDKEAEEKYIETIDNGNTDYARKIMDNFNLSPEFVKNATEKGFIENLKKGNFYNLEKIKKTISVSEEFLKSKRVEDAASIGLVTRLESGDSFAVIDFKERTSVPNDFFKSKEVEDATRNGFINSMKNGAIRHALEYGKTFRLSNDFMDKIVLEELSKRIKELDFECIERIRDVFNPKESYIIENGRKVTFDYLRDGNIDKAIEVVDNLNLSISLREIADITPEINNFFIRIKQAEPALYEKLEEKNNYGVNILRHLNSQEDLLKEIKNVPFLMDALEKNDRYGIKLLVKYPEFDEISKENISSLFAWEKEILQENPELDLASTKFRSLMQEKINNYKNNPEILAELEYIIDTDKWFNYEKEESFILKNEEATSNSEIVKNKINNLSNSIEVYMERVDDVIGDYENELRRQNTYPEQFYETQKLINEIRQRILIESDDKKTEDMEKGLDSQLSKLEKLKTKPLSIWNKVNQLSKSIIDGLTKIKESQSSLPKESFYQLSKDIKRFTEESLKRELSLALGDNQAVDIIDTIEQGLSENLEDIKSNIDQISMVFSQKSRESIFDGNEMTTKLWDKNPDVDLYQGNYSPCCISIEGGRAGNPKESTISDYLTDCSIQVVNIVDKKRNIPIAAAWCWIGKSWKTGENAFIVDNVEANNDYTKNYENLLTEKMEKYIKEYAEETGFKDNEIFQGEKHNDLDLGFKGINLLKSKNAHFSKIGPYNRTHESWYDSYYLEAEAHYI